MGSMLVGSREAIDRARSFRKALGGGMRQAGVLAAAGLIALEEGPGLLAEDHRNALVLADAVAAEPKLEIDRAGVQTNIVIFSLKQGKSAATLTAGLKAKGVLSSAIGPHAVRFVTHRDVDRAACERAASILHEELQSL